MAYDPDLHDLAKEAKHVVQIERLTYHIQRIREGQDEMKTSMQRMADAVSRLALVEERQANTGDALKEIAETVKGFDSRLRVLEIAEPLQSKTADWLERAIWAVAGFGIMAIVTKSGVL